MEIKRDATGAWLDVTSITNKRFALLYQHFPVCSKSLLERNSSCSDVILTQATYQFSLLIFRKKTHHLKLFAPPTSSVISQASLFLSACLLYTELRMITATRNVQRRMWRNSTNILRIMRQDYFHTSPAAISCTAVWAAVTQKQGW
jgi:hypothetical protein